MKIKFTPTLKKVKFKSKNSKGVSLIWAISKLDGAENFAMRVLEFEEGGFSPLHTHPYEHGIYVIEGEGVLVYEGKEYPIKKGDAILVPPKKEHQFKGKKGFKMVCIIPLPHLYKR